MEPGTDGAPLIFKSELLPALVFKSELLPPLNSEDGAPDRWGAPDFEFRTLTTPDLRGWSLGLMGRP